MATLNELIAQLNASSDNILADSAKANIVADDMNQTLDGMGVKEVSGIAQLAPGRTVGEQRDAGMYASGELQYDDVAPGDFGYVYTSPQASEKGLIGQGKNLIEQYIRSGGLLGLATRGIGSLFSMLPKRSQSDRYLLDTFGGYGQFGQQDKFGYNIINAANNYMVPGGNSFRSHQLQSLRGLNQDLANQFYLDNYGKTFDQVYKDSQKKIDPFSQNVDVGSGADYYGGGGDNQSDGSGGYTGGFDSSTGNYSDPYSDDTE